MTGAAEEGGKARGVKSTVLNLNSDGARKQLFLEGQSNINTRAPDACALEYVGAWAALGQYGRTRS